MVRTALLPVDANGDPGPVADWFVVVEGECQQVERNVIQESDPIRNRSSWNAAYNAIRHLLCYPVLSYRADRQILYYLLPGTT